jgi:tetratricopeptide (TPR) repeat protein
MGAHIVSAEGVSMHVKLHYIMISDDHGVSAAELAEMLPSLEDVIQKFNAGLAHCYMSIFNWDCSGFLLVGQACEKLGLYEQALPYAEMAATCRDITKGGCHVPATHCLGYRTKGRCLAALGKMAEAEEAFESSLASVAGLGLFLNEVLTLTDLKVLVLAKDGRAVEGSSRLKDAIHTLMGKSAAEDQLAALQVALGSDISVSEVLA